MNATERFLEAVRAAEVNGRSRVSVSFPVASDVRDFVATVIEARKKGGTNSKKNRPLKMDADSIRNREAVRRSRARKAGVTE